MANLGDNYLDSALAIDFSSVTTCWTKDIYSKVCWRSAREDLSNLSVPANSNSFGTGHDKNISERPSYLESHSK